MKYIYITGASGFVGQSIMKYFDSKYFFLQYSKNNDIKINEEIVFHFAGKAHDLKNIALTNSYYEVNTELTKQVFDVFLQSDAKVFITLSSVKAVADSLESDLTEDYSPSPVTHYGISKLLAEEYILNKVIPEGKRVYILRPCMIHGPGNKGNLNLLYKLVRKGLPWPLGSFENKRSFCSIDNLCFVLNELIQNDKIPSGIYNIADDESISTNELIRLIAKSQGKNSFILNIPRFIIKLFAQLGNLFNLPINTERLKKLTETYTVSNKKIKNAIKKTLPISAKVGLMKTLNSFGKINTP